MKNMALSKPKMLHLDSLFSVKVPTDPCILKSKHGSSRVSYMCLYMTVTSQVVSGADWFNSNAQDSFVLFHQGRG